MRRRTLPDSKESRADAAVDRTWWRHGLGADLASGNVRGLARQMLLSLNG